MTSGNEMFPPSRRVARRSAARSPVAAVDVQPAPRSAVRRWSRKRGVLSAFATFAALGFVAAYVGPTGSALSAAKAETVPVTLYAVTLVDAQSRDASDAVAAEPAELDRAGYSVYVTPTPTPTPTPTAVAVSTARGSTGWTPPFVAPDPGTAQAIAYEMVRARGWGDDEFACLVALWNKESGWRVNAYNKGSGAYGIPQALPGGKMASAGADWESNPATQITWGLGYISGRYGTPCGAWGHSQRTGWY